MSRARLVTLSCDVADCTNELSVRDRPSIAATARAAGWVAWSRGRRTYDLCPQCDQRLRVVVTGTAPDRSGA